MDNSKYWKQIAKLFQEDSKEKIMELEYLYGGRPKKTALDNQIEKAEKILESRQQVIERARERLITKARKEQLKGKDIEELSFDDIERMKEMGIKPKGFGKDDISPLNEPDIQKIKQKIIGTCNSLVPLLAKKGVSVAPLPEGSKTGNILKFVTYVAQALKNKNNPEPELEMNPDDEQYIEDEQETDIGKSLKVVECGKNGCNIRKNDELIFRKDGTWIKKDNDTMPFEIQDNIPELGIDAKDSILIHSDGTWSKRPDSELRNNPKYKRLEV